MEKLKKLGSGVTGTNCSWFHIWHLFSELANCCTALTEIAENSFQLSPVSQ